jgi:hypothetical protein
MSYPLSRSLSAATAAYGGYALVRPAHLWQALQADRQDRNGLELLAQTYGIRDLAISALGILGRSDRTVRAAMVMRIAMDLGDAVVLSSTTRDVGMRGKVLAITVGWAAANALALTIDTARSAED